MTVTPRPFSLEHALASERALREYHAAREQEPGETTIAGVCETCGLSLSIAGHEDDQCPLCGADCCRATMHTVRVPGESLDICGACWSDAQEAEEP